MSRFSFYFLCLCWGVFLLLSLSCERLNIPGEEITVDGTEEENKETSDGEKEEGSSKDDEEEPETGVEDTFEHPYTVAEVQDIGELDGYVWVEGYIVGWISGTSISGANFSSDSAKCTNLLLADRADETDVNVCIPVELVSGTNVRRDLNLGDNPLNRGRRVKLRGRILTYFRTVGLKSVDEYQWLDDFGDEEGEVVEALLSLEEDFSAYDIGDTFQPDGWYTTGDNLCSWSVGGRQGGQYLEVTCMQQVEGLRFETWLLTPPVNLDKAAKKVISFHTAYEGGEGSNCSLTVYVMEGQLPLEQGMLNALDIPVASAEVIVGNHWLYSGEVSLESYSGIKYIGFCYTGSIAGDDEAMVFRLDNLVVGK